MKAAVAIIFLPILALAQELPLNESGHQRLHNYVMLYSARDEKYLPDTRNFVDFANKLTDKKHAFKNEKSFVRYVFIKAHQRYLKHYTQQASFHQLLKNGTYNCLTGTALYALLLDHLDIDFRIIETNYHIFLLANTSEGKILLETTDLASGFVDDALAIEKRIAGYKLNIPEQQKGSKYYHQYNFDLFNEVSLDELLGLLHYNQAVAAYNNHELEKTINHLDEAAARYFSPRIEELSKIVLLSVIESNLEASVKEVCLRKIQSIWNKKVPVLALHR